MSVIRKLFDKVFGRGVALVRPLEAAAEPASYFQLPCSRQWAPGSRKSIDRTTWKPCESCGRAVPVELDRVITADGRIEEPGTWTYVCPFCSHCHLGAPGWPGRNTGTFGRRQEICHECGSKLGGGFQCPKCSFPRGWMRVDLPVLQESTASIGAPLGRGLLHV